MVWCLLFRFHVTVHGLSTEYKQVRFINLQHFLLLHRVWNFLYGYVLQESLVASYSRTCPYYIIASFLQCYWEEPLRLGEMHNRHAVSHSWLHTVASLRGSFHCFWNCVKHKNTARPIMSPETSGHLPVEDNAAEPQRQFNFLSYWVILRHYPISEYEFFFERNCYEWHIVWVL